MHTQSDKGLGVSGPDQAAVAEDAPGAALGRLLALSEAYPNLKANQNFLQLQGELGDAENKIAAARCFFNNAIAEYNSAIQQIPAVLFAGVRGFLPSRFFEKNETERAAIAAPPQVKF